MDSRARRGLNPVLGSICDSPWFTRKWVIQEYLLSPDSYFQCGGKSLDTRKLFKALADFTSRRVLFAYGMRGFAISPSFMAYLDFFEEFRIALMDPRGASDFQNTKYLRYGAIAISIRSERRSNRAIWITAKNECQHCSTGLLPIRGTNLYRGLKLSHSSRPVPAAATTKLRKARLA